MLVSTRHRSAARSDSALYMVIRDAPRGAPLAEGYSVMGLFSVWRLHKAHTVLTTANNVVREVWSYSNKLNLPKTVHVPPFARMAQKHITNGEAQHYEQVLQFDIGHLTMAFDEETRSSDLMGWADQVT